MGAGSIALIGGHPALDFANTAGWHASEDRSEHLTSYAEVLAWARHAGVLPAERLASLERDARRDPSRAARALRRIVELREVVYRVFTAIALGKAPAPEDLASLHEARTAALARAVPGWTRHGFILTWPDAPIDLLDPIHPVMIAAGELLAWPDRERLRQCGRDPCGWLFLDRSRNGSRRWCSSAECGNVTRVRRFRARQARG
jgi:predicted RNA-binding Zn ribbon-like protein